MLFNSLHFLVFFTVVFFSYFSLPHRARAPFLLAASCCFYLAWKPIYILVILGTTAVDYLAAIFMSRTGDDRVRKSLLLASLATNLGILFFFKYAHFFSTSINDLISLFRGSSFLAVYSIALPLGISFHTFQGMGYAIDVYRKRMRPQTNYLKYALFVMFFPQLVAGPIERAPHLLHQFDEVHEFDYRRVVDGLKLAAWGMFKKVVIADRLAGLVDHVYQDPHHFAGPSLVLATVLFAFQIYCDFSGYTDIAIGVAQVLGFDLMSNFRRPYSARSSHEFWQRWHISLSTWFRDYLYIPLGGNRVSPGRRHFNVLFTFIVSGFWHGAEWTFLLWGALNGAYVILGTVTSGQRSRLAEATGLGSVPGFRNFLKIAVTFSLICVAWVFFRATSVRDALYILTHPFAGAGEWLKHVFSPSSAYAARHIFLETSKIDLLVALAGIAVMEVVQVLAGEGDIRHLLARQAWFVRWPCYVALSMMIVALGRFGERQFIYFTF
jgi:D-alanyl-lipoteichoic acid acyltransferase DltB (MBOAT superfamily)